MVYKKYIKKNGRLYGPYIYHSRRVNGKVVSEYHGTDTRRNNKKFLSPFLWVVGIIFILLIAYVSFGFIYEKFSNTISGKAIFGIDAEYSTGELIEGNIVLNVKEGELIPANSKFIVETSSEEYEFDLSEVISASTLEGDYYVEGKSVSGSGEGFGSIGSIKEYPTVYFTLIVSSQVSSNESEEETSQEEGSESEEEETSEEVGDETSSEEESETPVEEEAPVEEETSEEEEEEAPVEEETSEEEEEESEPAPMTGNIIRGIFGGIFNFFLNLNPTGKVSLEITREVDGEVTKDFPFTYELSEGETASIKEGSVMTYLTDLDEGEISLSVEDNLVSVTTDYYTIVEEGFGEEYLGEETTSFLIDLGGLNITAEEGEFKIKIVYDSEDLVLLETTLGVNGSIEEGVEEEIEEVLNETLVQNVTNVTLVNVTTSLILTESEKSILLEEFGNVSARTSEAEIVNDRLVVKFEIGDYWVKNSYDYDGSVSGLEGEIEKDKIRWLKDLAKMLASQDEENEEVEELIGNFSI